MPLQADVAMALRAIQMGMRAASVEPVSQEWRVIARRTDRGHIIITIKFK